MWIPFTAGIYSLVAALSPPAIAGSPPPSGQHTNVATDRSPDDDFWLSPRLANLIISRWVEKVGEEYALDDAQRVRVRDEIDARWNAFLDEHRASVQSLATEFLEMRLGPDPPHRERVRAWSQKVQPLLEAIREQVDAVSNEIRKQLAPERRAEFELDASKLERAILHVEETLHDWRRGSFDIEGVWRPPAEDRPGESRKITSTRRAIDMTGSDEPAKKDEILAELDAWDDYVRAFIQAYRLDDGQRDAAISVLLELKIRALAHREHRRGEIARLEQRIEDFDGSNEQLRSLEKQLSELYGPIDAMFQELVQRIEPIPTAAQRTAHSVNKE